LSRPGYNHGSITRKKTNWVDLINESVHTSNDVDIGDIEAVSRDFVVVKRGFINVHYYYIPISKVEGWDGEVLWLKITEDEVKRNYERDIVPDPSRYYVKEYPYHSTSYYPALTRIAQRYQRPAYSVQQPRPESEQKMFKCDICGGLFKTEDDFSDHVKAQH
jgi:hypothetical protein